MAEIRDLGGDHGREAIETTGRTDETKNESVAVRAAEALLDRGYGRSMHGMEASGTGDRPVYLNCCLITNHSAPLHDPIQGFRHCARREGHL